MFSSWDYNWELKCYINGYYTSDQCNSSKRIFTIAQGSEADMMCVVLQRISPNVDGGECSGAWNKSVVRPLLRRINRLVHVDEPGNSPDVQM